MEKLVLIDGNSLINRAFYAMPLLTTKDGTFTNAVYGFMNMMFRLISNEKPNYLAVAFDVKAPTFRHKMYAEYKGTRKPMPEELRPQIPLLKEVLKLMNICVIEQAGIEADDIIGTIAKSTNIPTVIVTGDKDSFQLVDGETSVYFTKRGITDIEVYSLSDFKEKTGINPSQIIDLKSLMGDASDNIPGVSGVGEKTALTLVQKYGTVDNLYQNTEELTGKLKERIVDGKESAMLSKTLATINTHCDVELDTKKMRLKTPFSLEVKNKFTALEFKSLYKKDDLFETAVSAQNLFDTNSSIVSQNNSETNVEVEKITEKAGFDKISKSATLFIAWGKDISVYDGDKQYNILIKDNLFDEGLAISEAVDGLKELFAEGRKLVLFDKKSVRHSLKTLGIELLATADDVAAMKYLADFSGKEQTLLDAIEEYGLNKNLVAYALSQMYFTLKDKLKEEKMEELYYNMELPLIDVLFDMESAGFKVDKVSLDKMSKYYDDILRGLEKQIRTIANDDTINVNSPKQLGVLLFEKLKLRHAKKTKTGYSTSADILEEMENEHEVIPLILRYRQIQKLQSTYIEGFKPLIESGTGLIHTSFNQFVTATGRLSSKEPNLQNIPVRDDEGKEIRKLFIPRSLDRILIGADYSQIELRLLAAFSGCQSLIDAFNHGKDVHTDTASKVFNVDIESVTPQMRRKAKAVNFGIIYGISEYGLAKNIKTSSAEAREYIKNYFATYPEVKSYMDNNVLSAKKLGYAETFLGRRRYIREINSSNFNLRSFGERVAMNMPLQGGSADIIKIAMIKVSERIKKENLKSRLILQVHDELIVDAFKDEAEEIEKILKEEMENAVNLKVKLTVEIGKGETWFDAK